MTPMPYRTFMAWTTPACIIWAFLYVSIGSGAAQTYRELQDTVSWAGWIFIGIFVLAIAFIAIIKQILHRYSHMDDDGPEPSSEK
jgi:membrane protein DedA with SNARE-associated domain